MFRRVIGVGGGGSPATTPRPVIFDTDWASDVDDVVAGRIVCHAERIGLVTVLAGVMSTRYVKGPGSLDAFFASEGHPRLPIGQVTTLALSSGGGGAYQDNMFDASYPHREGYATTVMDSTDVYRRALAAADDGTVDIIVTGGLTCVSDLLLSPADSISALTGPALVTAKVRHLWVMGGIYPVGSESNFASDATSAQRVCANWPTPITFLGGEVGNTVGTGGNLSGTSGTDVLAKALLDAGYASGRSSWDPMLTWLAAVGDPALAGYDVVNGTVSVAGNGTSTFTAGAGNRRYVVKTQPDGWYQNDLNARLRPGGNPPVALLPGSARTAQSAPAIYTPAPAVFTRPARNTAANLLVQYHADDLRDLANNAAVSHLADRKFATPIRQTTSARPTFTTVGGLRCLAFASSQYLASAEPINLPSTFTVYALVRWATLPSSNQTLFAADIANTRAFHLTGKSGGALEGAGYSGASTDIRADAGGTATVNTWQVMAVRITPTEVETYLDGVSGGATASAGQNSGYAQLAVGSRYSLGSSEPFVGYLRDLRIYGAAHDTSTVATVSTEMLAPTLPNPSTISGLAAWYDASDSATLWTDTAGTAAATTADAVVARWDDKSGNARHATQSTSGQRPLLKLALQNGRNALYFDGTDDNLLTSINPSTVLTEGFTAMVVGMLDDTTGSTWSWIYGSGGGGASGLFFGKIGSLNGAHLGASGYHNGVNSGTGGGFDQAWHSFSQQESDVVTKAGVDGGQVYSAVGSNSSISATTLYIGGRGTTEPWKGPISELLIWNRVLSNAERKTVEEYFRMKWATP